jgi:hypothetical protein
LPELSGVAERATVAADRQDSEETGMPDEIVIDPLLRRRRDFRFRRKA